MSKENIASLPQYSLSRIRIKLIAHNTHPKFQPEGASLYGETSCRPNYTSFFDYRSGRAERLTPVLYYFFVIFTVIS